MVNLAYTQTICASFRISFCTSVDVIDFVDVFIFSDARELGQREFNSPLFSSIVYICVWFTSNVKY